MKKGKKKCRAGKRDTGTLENGAYLAAIILTLIELARFILEKIKLFQDKTVIVNRSIAYSLFLKVFSI